MPSKLKNQSGFAHILLIILLIAAIAIGIYLVSQRTSLRSRASGEVAETSINLVGRLDNGTNVVAPDFGLSAPIDGQTQSVNVPSDGTFYVDVLVKSNIDAVNLISAKLTYPANLIAVNGPAIISDPANPNFFITNWLENNVASASGAIRLSGGIATPGFINNVGQYGLMARIPFKALAGTTGKTAKIDFLENGTEIYRNSDNQLETPVIKRALNVNVVSSSTSPSPTASASVTPFYFVALTPTASSGTPNFSGSLGVVSAYDTARSGYVITFTGSLTGLKSSSPYEVTLYSSQLDAYSSSGLGPKNTDSNGNLNVNTSIYVNPIYIAQQTAVRVRCSTQYGTDNCLGGSIGFDSGGHLLSMLSPSPMPSPTPTGTPAPTAPPAVITIDLNNNGHADLGDASVYLSNLKQGQYVAKIDLNGDGVVNAVDFGLLVRYLLDNNVITQ